MANLMYFSLFLVTSLLDRTLGYDMTLNGNAVLSGSLEIHLKIGTINTAVNLYRPDGSTAGSCAAPIGGISCGTDLTQDLTTGVTTYSIATVSRTTDQGEWRSEHGTLTGNINITVLTIPTLNVSQSVSSLTLLTGTTQSLTITVTCAYPAVSLGLSFVSTGGGGTTIDAPSSTSTCSSTGNTGCTDTDANSYTCDITLQTETTLLSSTRYYVQVAVNLAGQYQSIGVTSTITDTEIIVPESSTVNPNTKTNSNNSGDNKTIIAIGVTGGCVGGIALIGGGVFFMKNRKKKKAGQESSAAGRE